MADSRLLEVKPFVANPAAPTITNIGTPGAAARSWAIVAVAPDGATSAASPAGSTSTGNATPSSSNFNRSTWPIVPGADHYLVFRTAGGATQGKIGTTAGTTFDDAGLAADGTTPSAANGTGIGAATSVLDLRDLTAQLDGTFVGTLQLEARAHQLAAFLPVGSTQTAPAFVDVGHKVADLRVRMTAYTSGAPAAYVCGNGRA